MSRIWLKTKQERQIMPQEIKVTSISILQLVEVHWSRKETEALAHVPVVHPIHYHLKSPVGPHGHRTQETTENEIHVKWMPQSVSNTILLNPDPLSLAKTLSRNPFCISNKYNPKGRMKRSENSKKKKEKRKRKENENIPRKCRF